MKNSQLFIFLLLSIMISTGCEKQDLGSLDAFYVHIPNVITIDGQSNNIFYVQVVSENPDDEYTVELMEIFDRYGNPMHKAEQFPTDDAAYGWDGTYEGDRVEPGTYSYSISVSDGTNERLFVGDFIVII